MKLLFKQKFLSFLDSYDIFDENGNTVYTVKSKFSFARCMHIIDASGNHVATLKQRLLSFLPCFEMYLGDFFIGCIKKEFSFFKPRFSIDCNGWEIEGNWLEKDYRVIDSNTRVTVATVSKQYFNFTDTYVIDVADPRNALSALMLVLAIDAEKSSRNN